MTSSAIALDNAKAVAVLGKRIETLLKENDRYRTALMLIASVREVVVGDVTFAMDRCEMRLELCVNAAKAALEESST